jgi:SPP1 gp7 family putative phage head morphogenesis protein
MSEPIDTPEKGIQPLTNQDNEVAPDSDAPGKDVSPGIGAFNFSEAGASGTRLFGEIFDEEYLQKLTGTRRADIYDEMLRSDDTITMLTTARKNPILKATWGVEPAKGETPEEQAVYDKQAKHVEHELFDRMNSDFMEFVEDALTFIEHGYSLFERVHEIVSDPKFGKYIGFKKFGWRSQRTIERWKCAVDGQIESVYQQAYSDVGKNVHIPGRYVTVFTLRKTGDNYEGISALRSIYGNWQRKNIFLKLIAIGIERYAINTPVGKIPAGKEQQQQERERFVNMLKAISSHHQNYFMLPAGWEVDFLKNPFDADKVVAVIKREDEGMVRSFMANHLNLGQGGSGGAYALGTDLSDQFLSIIENDAAIITRRFNKSIIREFIDLNYGKQSKYPKLTVSGINDKFSKEFAEIMKSLGDGKYITPTENLETWVRKRLGLPALVEADAAVIPDVRKTDQPSLFSEKLTGAQFADMKAIRAKVKGQIEDSADTVGEAMRDELKLRGEDFATKLINAMKKEKRDNWRKVIRNAGDLPQEGDFVKKIKKALIETAGRALAQARNEVPGGRKIKFCERVKSRIALAEVDDIFDSLPKAVKELILTDPVLVASSQFANLRTRLLMAASNAVDESGDIDVIESRIKDELSKSVLGLSADSEISGAIATAATNLTSKVYNNTRIEFFQTDEALEKIEAFMFMNTDPVSPICQDLNGRIFAKDDPSADEYLPPLHHNCKSFIVPLFNLQGKQIDDRGLLPSDPKLDKFKTL